jgi:hypothetical protein
MSSENLKDGFELVFTVEDYYDGPRKGIANYQGRPHFYECIFDEKKQNYSNRFQLTPLDQNSFEIALEAWEIWRRWEMAFSQGETTLDTHPALPHEAARCSQLQKILEPLLVTDVKKAILRTGYFEARQGPALAKGVMRPLQVKWEEG